jgi:hypothetical protein
LGLFLALDIASRVKIFLALMSAAASRSKFVLSFAVYAWLGPLTCRLGGVSRHKKLHWQTGFTLFLTDIFIILNVLAYDLFFNVTESLFDTNKTETEQCAVTYISKNGTAS